MGHNRFDIVCVMAWRGILINGHALLHDCNCGLVPARDIGIRFYNLMKNFSDVHMNVSFIYEE